MKRPRVVDGLREGAEVAHLPELGRAVGESGGNIVRYVLRRLTGNDLEVPQFCPVTGCANGTFSSRQSLWNHLDSRHPELGPRERFQAWDTVRIASAMQRGEE